eukprot:2941927-Amphidinium_carterae.1
MVLLYEDDLRGKPHINPMSDLMPDGRPGVAIQRNNVPWGGRLDCLPTSADQRPITGEADLRTQLAMPRQRVAYACVTRARCIRFAMPSVDTNPWSPTPWC